jgi:hypothetical protein
MKKSVATALVALAALATPLAIGQSQGLAIDPVVKEMAGTAHVMQVKASSFFAPRASSGTASVDSEKAGFNPDPATSWLMALVMLGIIAVRRMRG